MTIVKWPRTPHLPQSRSVGQGDILGSLLPEGPFVVTEKLDGECTTMTRDFVHARSGDSADHPSRHVVKALWSDIGWRIPTGMYLVGENVYARHSIYYPEVAYPYFYLFAVHTGGVVLSWDETVIVALMLGLELVPFVDALNDAATVPFPSSSAFGPECEGVVIRRRGRIPLRLWGQGYAAKAVRANHVQTDAHWMTKPVERNGMTNDR